MKLEAASCLRPSAPSGAARSKGFTEANYFHRAVGTSYTLLPIHNRFLIIMLHAMHSRYILFFKEQQEYKGIFIHLHLYKRVFEQFLLLGIRGGIANIDQRVRSRNRCTTLLSFHPHDVRCAAYALRS